MKLTESMLRRIIREEIESMTPQEPPPNEMWVSFGPHTTYFRINIDGAKGLFPDPDPMVRKQRLANLLRVDSTDDMDYWLETALKRAKELPMPSEGHPDLQHIIKLGAYKPTGLSHRDAVIHSGRYDSKGRFYTSNRTGGRNYLGDND